jgi:hypothetical protein
MRRLAFVLLLVTAACHRGMAQEVFEETDCGSLLSGAENDFAAGRFYGIPTSLKECIDKNRYSKEEQVRVYILLAQVYLLTDQPEAAEESYLKLLAANPEYIATEESDPIDVVYLSKKFTTTPIFTPHLKVGVNATNQSTIFGLTSVSKPDSVVGSEQTIPGFTVGAGIEWNINEKFGLGGEVLVAYKSFGQTRDKIHGNDYRTVVEKQFWVDLPFYFRYGRDRGNVRPYGYAGYAVNLLVRDRLQLVLVDISGTSASSTEGPDLPVLYKRYIVNGSVVVGGGLKYKFGKNFFLLDVRLMAGLTNTVREEDLLYDGKDSFDLGLDFTRYGYVDDIHRSNNLSLSLGFVRPLYDPRRLENARTKGVSRKLSR